MNYNDYHRINLKNIINKIKDVKMDTSTAGASGLKVEHQDDSVDDDSVFESGSNHADQCPPPVPVPSTTTSGPVNVAVPTSASTTNAAAAGPAGPTQLPPQSIQTVHAAAAAAAQQHRLVNPSILLPQTADPGTLEFNCNNTTVTIS